MTKEFATKEFAKLFVHEGRQILVTLVDTGNERPTIQLTWRPQNGDECGVDHLTTSMVFDEDDFGWELAEGMFAEFNESKALAIVQKHDAMRATES